MARAATGPIPTVARVRKASVAKSPARRSEPLEGRMRKATMKSKAPRARARGLKFCFLVNGGGTRLEKEG